MELPVASTTLTSELQDAARRAIGPATAAGIDQSFRTHLQIDPPATEPEPVRTDNEPAGEVRSSVSEEPAALEEHPAAASRDAPAVAAEGSAAPASPPTAAPDAHPAEPAAATAAAAAADTKTATAESAPIPTPAQPPPHRPRPATESAQKAASASPSPKHQDHRLDPVVVEASAPSAATQDTAVAPTTPTSLPVAPDGSAIAADHAPRRGSGSRREGGPRAAAAARGEGTPPGEVRGGAESVARGGARAEPAGAAAVRPSSEGPVPSLEMDRARAEPTPESGARGDPAARPPSLSDRLAHHLATRAETPTAPAVHVSPTDQQRLIQRVARAVEAAAQRGGVLRLRLRPPELGALQLEVTLQPGKLTARIETETPQARTILLDNLPQLRARLAEQGMVVERFDVDVSARDADQSSSGPQDWDPPGSSSAPARRPHRAQPTSTEPPARTALVSTTTPGTLNVVI